MQIILLIEVALAQAPAIHRTEYSVAKNPL
jgi:hypothetical protein